MSAPRILVVDDEPLNRELIRGIFQAEMPDATIIDADGPLAAYRIAEETPLDLVLLDVMMPGENGYSVCPKLKAMQEPQYLPVLLLTALNDQTERNAGLAAGADDFLSKPINRKELLLRVKLFLRLRSQEVALWEKAQEIERMSAFKDDLVSLLVHDLRNPLAAMLGVVGVMRSEAETTSQREDLEMILTSATRIRGLVDDLLQVRSLEVGQLTLSRRPAQLGNVADEAVQSVAGAARARGLFLKRDGDASASVDSALLKRAIENLVSNAIRHAPAGSHVEVQVADLDGRVVVSVLDRGPGVPEETKPSLFRRFGADEEARRDRRGYGLGLYLVHLVAQAHGGTAQVTDRFGGGAVFTIEFPLAA